MSKIGPDHFRYVDELTPSGLRVTCDRYVVLRESECCYWIAKAESAAWLSRRVEQEGLKKHPLIKRVLKESHGRRFAYPDKAMAFRSYKCRKDWQLRHAQLSLERAKAVIGYFGDRRIESSIPDSDVVIPNEYIQSMNWEEY